MGEFFFTQTHPPTHTPSLYFPLAVLLSRAASYAVLMSLQCAAVERVMHQISAECTDWLQRIVSYVSVCCGLLHTQIPRRILLCNKVKFQEVGCVLAL